jgi:microcystin-dependent protein
MSADPILGCIFMFAGNFAPRGFMFCQGQLLSIAQNSALFSLLGTTYGGDGISTFALPDLRGRAPIGTGQGPNLPNVIQGEMSGSLNVTLTTSNMPAHTHVVTISAAADSRPGSETPADCFLDNTAGTNSYAAQTDGTKMNAGMATAGMAGLGQPFNVQNPSLGMNYIIATEGIYPSRP